MHGMSGYSRLLFVLQTYRPIQIKRLGNVGPPSMTLAHIQRGVKHDTVTQYWANVNNNPVLGQRLVFDRLLDRRGERTDTKLIGRTNER